MAEAMMLTDFIPMPSWKGNLPIVLNRAKFFLIQRSQSLP